MKTARRQAREIALQALYAWQLSGSDPVEQARSLEGFDKTDASFVNALASGVRDRAADLQRIIAPHLDREFSRLSPIERAILYIGAFELAATTDMLVEGRHFLPGAEARALGHKALAVSLSDLAATGAVPRWATLAIALPAADESWLGAFAQGLFALADRYGVALVGGDTTRGPLLVVNITAFGEVPEGTALLRSGARPGHDIWVSGELGGEALALAHPEIGEAAKRLHEPEPRVALGERLREL